MFTIRKQISSVCPPLRSNVDAGDSGLRDFGLGRIALLAARKHFSDALDGLPFPDAHLVRVRLMLRCELLHGLAATQRVLHHRDPELIRKIPAFCHLRIPSKA